MSKNESKRRYYSPMHRKRISLLHNGHGTDNKHFLAKINLRKRCSNHRVQCLVDDLSVSFVSEDF